MNDYIEFENGSQISVSAKNGEKLKSLNDEKLKILGYDINKPIYANDTVPFHIEERHESFSHNEGWYVDVVVEGFGETEGECVINAKENERKVIDNLRELLDNIDPNEVSKLRLENQKLRELLVEAREYLDRATFGGLIQRIDDVLLRNEDC